jgi:hypothetical protein
MRCVAQFDNPSKLPLLLLLVHGKKMQLNDRHFPIADKDGMLNAVMMPVTDGHTVFNFFLDRCHTNQLSRSLNADNKYTNSQDQKVDITPTPL